MNKAWIKLNEIESNKIWNVFYKDFNFKPSVDKNNFPGIQEPAPFKTFLISDIYNKESNNFEIIHDNLQSSFLTYFQTLIDKQDWIYALDWQHECYKFNPHIDFELDNFNKWTVPILPNGDYFIFLEKNLKFGVFGHPWEQTMCIFGADLLNLVNLNPPTLFKNILRSDESTM